MNGLLDSSVMWQHFSAAAKAAINWSHLPKIDRRVYQMSNLTLHYVSDFLLSSASTPTECVVLVTESRSSDAHFSRCGAFCPIFIMLLQFYHRKVVHTYNRIYSNMNAFKMHSCKCMHLCPCTKEKWLQRQSRVVFCFKMKVMLLYRVF